MEGVARKEKEGLTVQPHTHTRWRNRLADKLFGDGGDGESEEEAEPLFSYDEYIPTVVFSHPPIGTVGLTEDQARERIEGVDGDADLEVCAWNSTYVNLEHALAQVEPREKQR